MAGLGSVAGWENGRRAFRRHPEKPDAEAAGSWRDSGYPWRVPSAEYHRPNIGVRVAHEASRERATVRNMPTHNSRSSTGIRSFAECTSVVASSVSMVLSGK